MKWLFKITLTTQACFCLSQRNCYLLKLPFMPSDFLSKKIRPQLSHDCVKAVRLEQNGHLFIWKCHGLLL